MSATLPGALTYWSARLGGEQFTAESQQRQACALQSALDSLAPYLHGIPDSDAEAAVYEQAHWLLGSRAELQAQGVVSMSISGISESFGVKGRPASVAPSAWRIIKCGSDGKRGRGPVWL